MRSFDIFTNKGAVTDVVEVPILAEFAHSFAGIKFYDAGGVEVTPTAGLLTVEVQPFTHGRWVNPQNPTIDAADPATQADWQGNVTNVRVTPAGVAGAVTYKVNVICNRS